MRIREIDVVENIQNITDGNGATKTCEWPGCRNFAKHLVKYKVRTGRVKAGQWQDRKMLLCDGSYEIFKEKYMKDLCPKCHANPVDENSYSKYCTDCQ